MRASPLRSGTALRVYLQLPVWAHVIVAGCNSREGACSLCGGGSLDDATGCDVIQRR